jgi:hypothetical protein
VTRERRIRGSSAREGLRLVVYDRTDVAPVALPRITRNADGTASGTGGLTRYWKLGTLYHRLAWRAHASAGFAAWSDALTWAVEIAQHRGAPIAELQAWGHGGFGYMQMGRDRWSAATMDGELAPSIERFRGVLHPEALVWFRCCSAFGHTEGRAFAKHVARTLRCRVAGHTYIIGFWQSGTHSVTPAGEPSWAAEEGIDYDDRGHVRGAKVAAAGEPRTLSALRFGLPDGW